MHTKKELDELLRISGIQPLKKLGQNFLVNPRICQALIDSAVKFHPATLVEVGPGLGALTADLINTHIPLTLIELDSGLVKYWESEKFQGRVRVIHADALKLDWNDVSIDRPALLISNLPYSIAASLVIEMTALDIFDTMILMFQKEVAERFQSSHGVEDYGMPSVVAQNFWKVSKLVDAGPQDFYPVPNVGSRVLIFERINNLILREKFISFVKTAFSQRRKKLIRNLESVAPRDTLKAAFEKLKFNQDSRAEELSPQDFQKLFSSLN